MKIPPIVTSCYQSQYAIMDGQENVIIPVTKQTCISPQNQYCSVKTICIDTGILKKISDSSKTYWKYVFYRFLIVRTFLVNLVKKRGQTKVQNFFYSPRDFDIFNIISLNIIVLVSKTRWHRNRWIFLYNAKLCICMHAREYGRNGNNMLSK